MKKKLFLICPECHIEQEIRDKFDGDIYFLTALGAVFCPLESDEAGEICDLISREEISEVGIVCATSCSFIQSIINDHEFRNTAAEVSLLQLYQSHPVEFALSATKAERAEDLSRLNIANQIKLLHEDRQIGPKISSNQVSLKGYVYNPERSSFHEAGVAV
mgnify:CR=1 FL=1